MAVVAIVAVTVVGTVTIVVTIAVAVVAIVGTVVTIAVAVVAITGVGTVISSVDFLKCCIARCRLCLNEGWRHRSRLC